MSEVRLPDSIACTSEEQNTYTLSKIATANSNLLQSGQILAIGNSLAKVVPALESNKQQSRVLKTMRSKCEDLPRTLDGLLLLKLCRVEFPDEVVEAMISDMHITDVVAEDLLSFTKLTRLDMSDNKTSLEPFGCLPALVELDIQCNAIKEVTIENGFQNLEVLNLSYNCLRSKDVQVISKMQRIRELYLGSNQICSVPPMMDHFSRLEILSLESNNISGQEIFSMLSIMPRLLDLNLSYNQITGFPESALTTENTCGTGFYNLVYLNLAHNTIMNEEAIIHTSKLRSLRKLILYGNPLAHAAITPYDSTKLAYDPVPNLTRLFNERTTDQIATTIVSAYPDTKKKKLHSMSCYEHVEIYKIIPNEVVFQSPFRTRATEIIEADFFKRKMPPSKQQVCNFC
ncbi:putative X-ray radiation resistance-associated protein [Plasmopara halstedii]